MLIGTARLEEEPDPSHGLAERQLQLFGSGTWFRFVCGEAGLVLTDPFFSNPSGGAIYTYQVPAPVDSGSVNSPLSLNRTVPKRPPASLPWMV